jgi:hypothetical protein
MRPLRDGADATAAIVADRIWGQRGAEGRQDASAGGEKGGQENIDGCQRWNPMRIWRLEGGTML